jgi:spore coat protein CotH
MKPLLLIVFLVAMLASPGLADSVDELFDPTRLHDVRITMDPAAWAALRANYLSNTNYDGVTITFDGETVTNASLRSRGSGTRNGVKPGLRVDFSRTVKSQRFRGFKVLVLDNMYNDFSFLREQLAFSIFRETGILVPRESFARVTVNGEYWGLYAIVEPIDQIFVGRHIDAGGGNLFEYNAPAAERPGELGGWDFALSRGSTVADYVPEPLEPKTNEDSLDGAALLAFLTTISETADETFIAEISKFVDPQEILTYYAVEVATAEVDGLTSFFGVNNFYLYQLQGTSQFRFIPWDHDFNFTSATHSIWFGAHRNRLIQRLLSDPGMKSFYLTTLKSIVDRYLVPSWMTPRIDSMTALIRPSVLEDGKWRGAGDPAKTFDEAVAHIRTVVEGRAASVDAQTVPGRPRPLRR